MILVEYYTKEKQRVTTQVTHEELKALYNDKKVLTDTINILW